MTVKKEESISLEEATRAVETVSRRVALLHLAYAKTLVEEFGEKKAWRLITKAVRDYGAWIGEKTKREVLEQRLEPVVENFEAGRCYGVPGFGMSERVETVTVNNEKRTRVYGCSLAKVWKEYGGEKLGRLYCYVDPAKYMGYNPNYKQVHSKTVLNGDDYCEMTVKPTTEKERRDFADKKMDWIQVDTQVR